MLKSKLKLKKKDLDSILIKKEAKLINLIRDNYFDLKVFVFTPPLGTGGTGFKAVVIISSKIFKSSVNRNKVKRRFYNILEGLSPALSLGKGDALIFYPKKESLDLKFSILEQEVYNAIKS